MCYTTEEIVYERKNVLQQEIRVRELDVVARTESVIICVDSLRERMNKTYPQPLSAELPTQPAAQELRARFSVHRSNQSPREVPSLLPRLSIRRPYSACAQMTRLILQGSPGVLCVAGGFACAGAEARG
jgi:hypothetical protein